MAKKNKNTVDVKTKESEYNHKGGKIDRQDQKKPKNAVWSQHISWDGDVTHVSYTLSISISIAMNWLV